MSKELIERLREELAKAQNSDEHNFNRWQQTVEELAVARSQRDQFALGFEAQQIELAAIKAQPAQEPVATTYRDFSGTKIKWLGTPPPANTMLYTAPQATHHIDAAMKNK